MITNRQKFSLIYFITNSFFLASGYSLIFKISKNDSWISMIIGIIIGLTLVNIFNHFGFNEKRKYFLNEKKNILEKIISLLFFSFIIFVNITVTRIFATSFFLTKTPGIIITIPFMYLSIKAAKNGINTISKISEILLPISIMFIILSMLAVCKDGSLQAFLPILITSKKKIILSSIYFAILTSIPQLLLFDIKIEKKKHSLYYLITSLITLFVGAVIIFTMGSKLISIFRFPEYMVLKQIKLFNFIEKIENLIGLMWFFDLFISTSISIYNMNKVNSEKNYISYILLGSIIYFTEYITKKYTFANFLYQNIPWFLLITGLLFFILIFIKKRRIKKGTNSS